MSDQRTAFPPVVVMGVSAAGKSSVGRALAQEIGATFVDADDLHPAVNVAKMSAGVALVDDDRWSWLDIVGGALAVGDDTTVMACSALARRYRDRIRAAAPTAVFVHLHGTDELLSARAAARTDHFMPPALLASQLATLEPLGLDERGITLDVAASVSDLAADAARYIRTLG